MNIRFAILKNSGKIDLRKAEMRSVEMADHDEIQVISKFFKVISDSTRLSILYLLKEKERNVSDIVEIMGMEQSAISHQLRILKDSRLVRSHREGKSMIYQLDDDHIFDILNYVRIHINERDHEEQI